MDDAVDVKNKTNLGGMTVKDSCINVKGFYKVKAMQPINGKKGK